VSDAAPRSYYGQPVIKAPVWKAYIPWYFFFGGLAGASAPLAAVAGVRGNRALERRAWTVALAGIGVSPGLLIADLGRPERFHHMLRVVKVTSPMNVGTWLLSATGTAVGLAWARCVLGWFPRAGRVGSAVAAAAGPALATYTAVLIADTSVPVWYEARQHLPFVFAASSAASAGGTAILLAPERAAGPARRLALGGAVGEIVAGILMERRLGELAEPYRRGKPGRLARAAKGCTLAGAALLARRRARAGGALLVAGAALERWAVFTAGRVSAADPKYTVGPQRSRRGRR
jgi:hypothetical protein